MTVGAWLTPNTAPPAPNHASAELLLHDPRLTLLDCLQLSCEGAQSVLMHSMVQGDLKGIPAAQNYWQAYFDKYTFEHEVLATAEDNKSGAAFLFWLDRVRFCLSCFGACKLLLS